MRIRHTRSLKIVALLMGTTAAGVAIFLRTNTAIPHVIILAVMDTVRADHLSICGYPRPTSPNLEQLVELGATHTCDAYAPGDWTLPSHASYFTGLPVVKHGAIEYARRPGHPPGMTRILPRGPPTLAEQLRERGYQTVSVSANPLIAPSTGLTRGFEIVHADRRRFGEDLLAALRKTLDARLDIERPLFLFVNILDAHTPFQTIPDDVDWLPAREGFDYRYASGCAANDLWRQYIRGEMNETSVSAFLERLADVYDYGVWRADRNLGAILEELRRRGWLKKGFRIVVTSDHGEFLGEHGLLSHGLHTYEGNQRVPLLYYQENPPSSPALEGPISAMAATWLAREGALPDPPLPVEAVATPGAVQAKCSEGRYGTDIVASAWQSNQKINNINGKLTLVDLAADPGETAPVVIETHALADRVNMLAQMAQSAYLGTPQRGDLDSQKQVLDALRSLGYVH